MSAFITNIYFIAIGIPIILLLCGSLAKKLARGAGWQRFDFFLGVEFALVAMSSALMYLFDLARLFTNSSNLSDVFMLEKLYATCAFIPISFFALLLIVSTHQDWITRQNSPFAQLFWLGMFCNFLGAGLIILFIVTIKGF